MIFHKREQWTCSYSFWNPHFRSQHYPSFRKPGLTSPLLTSQCSSYCVVSEFSFDAGGTRSVPLQILLSHRSIWGQEAGSEGGGPFGGALQLGAFFPETLVMCLTPDSREMDFENQRYRHLWKFSLTWFYEKFQTHSEVEAVECVRTYPSSGRSGCQPLAALRIPVLEVSLHSWGWWKCTGRAISLDVGPPPLYQTKLHQKTVFPFFTGWQPLQGIYICLLFSI